MNRLCSASEVDSVTTELEGKISSMPPRTATLIKENLNRAAASSFADALDQESLTQSLVLASEDTREAILAWVQK